MRGPRARVARALDRRFAALADRVDALRGELDAERERSAELAAAVERLAAQTAGLHEHSAELAAAVEQLATQTAGLHEHSAELAAAVERLAAQTAGLHERLDDRVLPLLRSVAFEDAEMRRRLDALRSDPAYESPWTLSDPLVTVCISVIEERADVLAQRALPSALGQTHATLEVVVVGDGFDPASHPGLRAFAAQGVRFGTVTQRMTHPGARRHWYTAATLAPSEARRMARGLWVTDLDDDDALRPDAVECLLAHARATRSEVAYGLIQRHDASGAPDEVLGGWPPEPIADWTTVTLPYWRGRASSAALVHDGLRFFPRRHVAGDLGVPGDQFLVEQMVRAGVRFAHLDRVVYDYFPGGLTG